MRRRRRGRAATAIGVLAILLLAAGGPVSATGEGRAPIPEIERWKAQMVKYGRAVCDRLSEPRPLDDLLGLTYYDGQRVFLQIAEYTGDTAWIACAEQAAAVYRDRWVLVAGGSIPGHWNFTDGLTMDYRRTGNERSKRAVVLLSARAAYARDRTPLAWTRSAYYSREVAYALLSYINAEALGQPKRQRRADLVDQAYDHMEQWFVRFTWRGPWQRNPPVCDDSGHCSDRLAPFMVGLTAHALIRDWEQTKDPRLIPALRRAADWMWANAWVPSAQAMWYEFPDQNRPCCHAGEPAPDLNLLIAPVYAFLYRQTGEAKYREQADALFAGGVQRAWLGGGKQFNQNFWWSFDYVRWRSQDPSRRSAGPSVLVGDGASRP